MLSNPIDLLQVVIFGLKVELSAKECGRLSYFCPETAVFTIDWVSWMSLSSGHSIVPCVSTVLHSAVVIFYLYYFKFFT